MTFNPFPKLQSERLNLREITSADSATILFLRSDKTVNKFIEKGVTDIQPTLVIVTGGDSKKNNLLQMDSVSLNFIE